MTQTIYSKTIDDIARRSHEKLWDSTLGHQEAHEELWDVWQECNRPGWDGYGALPIEQDTLRGAYLLIESLPLGFPRPAVSADPDGQITLEWYKKPTRTVSVSVDPAGYLHYAGLFGDGKKYGTLEFFGTAPSELIRLVREL